MTNAEVLLKILFISLSPVLESRVAIPYGIANEVELPLVLLISLMGNMAPVPFILLTMSSIERWITRRRSNSFFKRIFTTYINNLRKRASSTVKKYGLIGLTIFVAIPIPGTGAWTGSVVAYLFGLESKKAVVAILLGVLISILIVTLATLWLSYVF